ncbi:MAG: glycosyl hydrolase [Bacteroidetes bacterium HGW-Bacteroidetes-4]|jgi:glucosylceramidase|nr:MAG: glycosyl hydrolase [Bacteroidetes bacterium HGW-Bacteroidetes-4]
MKLKIILSRFFAIMLVMLLNACGNQDKQPHTPQNNNQQNLGFSIVTAEQYLTAKESNARLTKMESLKFEPFNQPDEHFATLMVDPTKTFQTIEGFGGALTDATAETLAKLSPENQEKIYTAYFDKKEGIGYNLFRTHINSCDFSSQSYAYAEVDSDFDLRHFSIERDLKFRIPLIKEAIKRTGADFKLLASPWSPPAWMKTNQHMLQGGELKPEHYQTWANYFVRFIEAYRAKQIPVWAVSVQNEPMAVQTWESCVYTAEQERDFVKNNLGPTFEKHQLSDVKIVVWDHNRGIMYQRASTVYDDPDARKYVWGTGFHWYTGDHFDNVKQVAEAFPDKKLLFTEGCVFPFNYDKLNDWNWGERYGESVIKDLNNSAVGWIDWNIVLDEKGGPNHVANYCFAPVIGNTQTDEVIFMNSFYYLGHFSRFIRPGAKRIICSSNYDDLLATAAINQNGSIVVVAMNQTDKEIPFKIWIQGKGVQTALPAHAIKTTIIN